MDAGNDIHAVQAFVQSSGGARAFLSPEFQETRSFATLGTQIPSHTFRLGRQSLSRAGGVGFFFFSSPPSSQTPPPNGKNSF